MEERKKKYLSAREVKEVYGISRWTAYLWAIQGKLPSIKVGKLRRFEVAALDQFMKQHETKKGGQEICQK